MSSAIGPLSTHNRHHLKITRLNAPLDVLAFDGKEQLSQPFNYAIEFTCTELDLAADQLLGRSAAFSLHPPPQKLPYLGLPEPEIKPLRTRYGVIGAFQRLSASRDEARYQVTLQPRLARLGLGRQYRIYQDRSVPQIVEQILRERHDFRGQDFLFTLAREYPLREQVMQYGESDLAFISRLLAEVGIWYRFSSDDRLGIEVVEFHDDTRHYQFGLVLPQLPPSGLSSGDQDAVWQLQASHQVVEQQVNIRAYDHRDAHACLDGEIDHTRGALTTTYGEAYHYAEAYRELGDRYARDERLQSESGYFYARLRHERYLNQRTRLSGVSSSASMAPGQVLEIAGEAPAAFAERALITAVRVQAARDSSLRVTFEGMPFDYEICFRPPLLAKPQIAGTVPARVSSTRANDPYGHIDLHGRYKVRFLFDRDSWRLGEESLWLRLARPYAGDTHGLHLPLLAGTEVAVAFEQGDPDRPYIAHALHDNQHPDPVSLRNYKRNVLRTPANNKLRLDDTRGQEHIKLSTEHSGKSQLNLGYLVDAKKQKRGEGFELRSDGWGAIRAGKGVFISADEQAKARGEQLDMNAAIEQLESALSLARSMANAACEINANAGDIASQEHLNQRLKGLAQPGVVLHAPAGIGVVSPKALCVASGGESVGIMAAHNVDISAGGDMTVSAEDAISLVSQRAGMQFKAAAGKVELHALGDSLHTLAKTDIKIESVAGRVEISAPQELVLKCGGAYIRLKDGEIELGAPGNIYLKAAHVQKLGAASLDTPVSSLPAGYAAHYTLNDGSQAPMPFTRYRVTTQQGEVFSGVTDKDGRTMSVHTLLPGELKVEFPQTTNYDEQLRLVGPGGERASHLKYRVTLADGSVLDGMTDEQGQTQRIVTKTPTRITGLALFPPENAGAFCCAAQNAQAALEIDLTASDISTNDTSLGGSVQNVSLPKGKKRALTAGEIAMARTVFKDSVDYTKVKVHHGGWWVFFGLQNTAVTPNGEMYFPESTELYRDDFSNPDRSRYKALFMHEMTHVWQYQLGYPVKKRGLTITRQGLKVYEYSLSVDKSLSDYNLEQQGEILSDYYMICILRRPQSVWDRVNQYNEPSQYASTLREFLKDPSATSNLPK